MQRDLIEILRQFCMTFVCNMLSYLPENYTELQYLHSIEDVSDLCYTNKSSNLFSPLIPFAWSLF